jgi:hypothetical protein
MFEINILPMIEGVKENYFKESMIDAGQSYL